MAQGIRFDAAQSRCVTYDLPEPLTESQIYTLGKLAARARYNADHVKARATAEERRNLQDKAEALERPREGQGDSRGASEPAG